MELAPGLHRIGNDMIAAHLIVADEGITVVDAGLPGHYRDLIHELRLIGRPLSDIRGVVLTHGDRDHIGFAERVRTEVGVPVFVGAEDAARAMGEKPPATPKPRSRIGPMLGFFAYGMRKGGLRAPRLGAVRAVFVGDAMATRHVLTGAEGPQPAPFTDDQARASASLDRIAALDVDWVIVGHGPAFRGTAADALAAYRAAEQTG